MRMFPCLASSLLTAVVTFAAPGDLKWSIKTGGAIRSSPAFGTNDWVIFGSFDNSIYALSPETGAVMWKSAGGGPVISSPTILEDGQVVIGTSNGLLALNGLTGGQRWMFRTNQVLATPTVDGTGKVYFLNERGILYAADSNSGALSWSTNLYSTFAFVTVPCYSSPIIGRDGILFSGTSSQSFGFGSESTASFRSIDPASGQARRTWKLINSVQSTPAIGLDGTIFFCGFDKTISAIDPATGARKWQRLLGDSISSSPALGPDGTLYVGAHDGYFYALDSRTGEIKWRFLTGDSIHSSPAVATDGTVYFGSYDKNFYALDGKTGTRKWVFTTGGLVLASPLIGPDGTVYFGSYDKNFYALEGSAPPALGVWSMFKGNARHTGSAADTLPVLLANPRFEAAGFAFELQPKPGKRYRIEYSEDLNSSTWTELTNVSVTASSILVVDPSASVGRVRYYRARTD